MQNLKVKLADQGLVGVFTIRETGQKIPLRFGRGETAKLCKLELGPTTVDVELRLVEVPGAKVDQPNLTLAIVPLGTPVIESANSAEEQAAGVDAAAKAEAEAKAKADAEAKEREAADEAERQKAAEATKAAEEEAAAQKAAEEEAAAQKAAASKTTIPVETPTATTQSVAPAPKAGRR